MKKSIALTILTVVLAYFGETTQAAGNIGNPANGSRHSGIGIITGWVCDANEVNLILDYEEYIPVLYGIERKDVRQCDNAGFIALWNGSSIFGNWSSLGAGQHHINAYADGVKFASRTFYVGAIKEDSSTIVDKGGYFTIDGFPNAGDQTTITWNQGLQNFVVVDATLSPPIDNPFVGKGQMSWRVEIEDAVEDGYAHTLTLNYDATLGNDIISVSGFLENYLYPDDPDPDDTISIVTGAIKVLSEGNYYLEFTTGYAIWTVLLDQSLNGTMSGWNDGTIHIK